MANRSGQPNWLGKIVGEMNHRQKTVIVGAVLVAGLFLGGQLLIPQDESANIPSVVVKRGQVEIKITEIGELRAQDQVTIGAINDKQIIWMVPEGQWVEQGDTLLVFESEKYQIALDEAETTIEVAQAGLEKAMGELDAHKAREEGVRKNYESLPELAKQGFVMESAVEQARLNYIELKNRTKSFEATVRGARANVRRAERAYAQQDRKFRQSVQVAPRAGLVVYALVGSEESAKKIEVGMIPFEGMDLMYLPDISTMLVDAEISEVELNKMSAGQPARVRLDAYPGVVFKGEVASIADLAKRKISRITRRATGAKVFDVTVKVLESDIRLKPGLTATVDIIVNHHEDALYIPLEAIFIDEQEQPYVHLTTKRGLETRSVSIGESNDRVAIVTEGLKEGEQILLGRPTTT